MSETAFKIETEAGIRSSNFGAAAHFSYIESPETSPGIPDVNIAFPGIEVFIEFKFSNNPNKMPRIRPSQVRWFRKRSILDSRSFLFAKLDGSKSVYTLFSGIRVEDLNKFNTVEDWTRLSTIMWCDEVNWNELVYIITRG